MQDYILWALRYGCYRWRCCGWWRSSWNARISRCCWRWNRIAGLLCRLSGYTCLRFVWPGRQRGYGRRIGWRCSLSLACITVRGIRVAALLRSRYGPVSVVSRGTVCSSARSGCPFVVNGIGLGGGKSKGKYCCQRIK